MKSDNRSLIAFAFLLLLCSSCGAAGPPFLYPHTNSPYLIQPKLAQKKQEPAGSQPPSISPGSTSETKEAKSASSQPQNEPASSQASSISPGSTSEKKEITSASGEPSREPAGSQPPSISPGSTSETKEAKSASSQPQRERVFIDAPYERTWQAVLKFCVLNKYQIVKESKDDGTIECKIASNNAQYSTSSLPEDVLKFVSVQAQIHGIVAWDITMAIFLSPSNNKTLVEFIPNFYVISTESSHAKAELKSSGYFEGSCVSFINEEVKSY